MDALSLVLIGGLVSALTQICKRFIPNVQPLLFVALFAVIAGTMISVVLEYMPERMINAVISSFSVAVAIYETLSKFVPEKE